LLSFICSEHSDNIPLRLANALERKKQLHKAFLHRRTHFAYSVGLSPKSRGQKMANIGTAFLPKLKSEYPPSHFDIYESEAAHKTWKEYRDKTPYPDCRGKWKPFHKLDPDRLQYTVQEGESVIIRDSETKEIVCMVIQNFSENKGDVLDWVNEVIRENTDVRKSVQASSSPVFFFGWWPDYYSSSKILGSCARLATPLVHGTAPNLDGQGICSATRQTPLLAG
jgi:hypothetical protein